MVSDLLFMCSLGNIDSFIIRKSHKAMFLRSYSLIQESKKIQMLAPNSQNRRRKREPSTF